MKAVIPAAGMGTRLYPLTSDRPKCMVDVGGTPLLQRSVGQLRAAGISEIVVVGGYMADRIDVAGVTLEHNVSYRTSNILHSFFTARRHLYGEVVFLYADIAFDDGVLEAFIDNAVSGQADIILAVDPDWRETYRDRTLHPMSEAELVVLDGERMVETGKHLQPAEANVEWCGLAFFSARGLATALAAFIDIESTYERTRINPFPHARSFEQAYMTDLFTELVRRGEIVRVCPVRGGWVEIDTPEDLARALTRVRDCRTPTARGNHDHR